MSTQYTNSISMESRIIKLEKQSRRMTFIASSILLAAAAIITMGQASPKSKIQEADAFVIKDSNGFVRVWLGLENNVSALRLYGPQETQYYASISHKACLIKSNTGWANIEPNHLYIQDSSGFETKIGASQMQNLDTGQQFITSAASINLFNNKGAVIWKAP